MSKSAETTLAYVAIPFIIGSVALHAVTFWMLWNWFIAPLGTPAISLPHAVGISLTIGLITARLASQSTVEKLLDDEGSTVIRLWKGIATNYFISGFALIFGWLLTAVWGV